MTEQPNTGPEQAKRDDEGQAVAESWAAQHAHVRTDQEIAVDDALGTTDNPH